MGVKGLWSLVSHLGKPTRLETLSSQTLAVDASIWLHQFLKAMRDPTGHLIHGAHLVGFFRRICKLLFYGIRPVFVYDGAAPQLKRQTLALRRDSKKNAKDDLKITAEKLLQAQLKLAAANALTEGALPQSEQIAAHAKDLKRKRDEFELPDGSLPQDSALDPRLVSDAELRDFINEHRHELNLSTDRVDSTAFKNLPIEVQHEIILDLKSQSRQPSQKRLAKMVKDSDSALAFSQHQIKHLVERNFLTERLFEVAKMSTASSNPRLSRLNETGFVGAVQRVAGQRNRQFALLKGSEGGYTMAVQNKSMDSEDLPPMDSSEVVDLSSDSDDGEIFQVVEKMQSQKAAPQSQAFIEEDATVMSSPSIASEDLPLSQAAFSTKSHPKSPVNETEPIVLDEELSPDELAVNTGAWIADEESVESIMARFKELEQNGPTASPIALPSDKLDAIVPHIQSDNDSEIVVERNRFDHTEDEYLELWIKRIPQVQDTADIPNIRDSMVLAMTLWTPDQVSEELERTIKRRGKCVPGKPRELLFAFLESFLKDLIEFKANVITPHTDAAYQNGDLEVTVEESATTSSEKDTATGPKTPEPSVTVEINAPVTPVLQITMDPRIKTPIHTHTLSLPASIQSTLAHLSPNRFSKSMPLDTIPSDDTHRRGILAFEDLQDAAIERITNGDLKEKSVDVIDDVQASDHAIKETIDAAREPTKTLEKEANQMDHESRVLKQETIDLTLDEDQDEDLTLAKDVSSEEKEDLDLMFADLTDVPLNFAEEEQEYARFVSQFSQDPQVTTQQLQSELETLRLKKRQEMRDASDVTTAMISETQELLRLFGLPFIVAPTEAESQCAFLATSGLTNGIVTDDSDVFLFGGAHVYRHFFNQQKFCETFLMSEMESKMALERDRLIQMAYLVGSDYTPGIQGIGPVRALEILREWDLPRLEGLKAFKAWVNNVQRRIFDESDSPMKKKMASLNDAVV